MSFWQEGLTVSLTPGTHFASVIMSSQTCTNMHSSALFLAAMVLPISFVVVLKSYGDSSLWENLKVDGDDKWIRKGALSGMLVIAHDGSYMALELPVLCSVGVIIYCKRTKQ
jgi:hypothetical protein